LWMEACTIRANIAWTGGGVYARSIRLTHCIISGNVAGDGGGGVWSADGIITNCTIIGNRAAGAGGGLSCNLFSDNRICNTVVSENRANRDHSLSLWGCHDILTPDGVVAVHNCNIAGGQGMVGDGLCRELYLRWGGGNINIETDPCFANLGHWDPNGTVDDPNDDFWVQGDYHLKSQAGRWDPATESWVTDDVTSPCIDAGDPMSPIGHEPFPNGGIVNMGAYGGTAEAGKSYFGEPPCQTIVAGDINGDCRVDYADLALLCLHWLQQQ